MHAVVVGARVLLQPGHRRGGGGALIADAVLRYERGTDDGGVWLATVLIEVDRGTYPVARLARKVATYAALATPGVADRCGAH